MRIDYAILSYLVLTRSNSGQISHFFSRKRMVNQIFRSIYLRSLLGTRWHPDRKIHRNTAVIRRFNV